MVRSSGDFGQIKSDVETMGTLFERFPGNSILEKTFIYQRSFDDFSCPLLLPVCEPLWCHFFNTCHAIWVPAVCSAARQTILHQWGMPESALLVPDRLGHQFDKTGHVFPTSSLLDVLPCRWLACRYSLHSFSVRAQQLENLMQNLSFQNPEIPDTPGTKSYPEFTSQQSR